MISCLVCAFDAELDDAVVITAGGRCICLRCFVRVTDNQQPMPKQLRQELTALLAASPNP